VSHPTCTQTIPVIKPFELLELSARGEKKWEEEKGIITLDSF